MSFDIELDSIEIDQCDVPQAIKPDKKIVHFYGSHACRNVTTKVRWSVYLTASIWHVDNLTILYITYIDNYMEEEYEE